MPAAGRNLPGLGARLLSLAAVGVLAAADQVTKSRAFESVGARGGILDVLDSLLLTLPFIYYYILHFSQARA